MDEERQGKTYCLKKRLINSAVRIIRMAESLPKTKAAIKGAIIWAAGNAWWEWFQNSTKG
jgi:hypothetical protein